MITLNGTCQSNDLTPVLGKLCFPERKDDALRTEACLAVLSHNSQPTEDQTVVGTILLSERDAPLTQSCPVLRLPSLSAEYHGQIALLDPKTETLFISPDLPTLGRYAKALGAACEAPFSEHRAIRSPEEITRRDADGWLLTLPTTSVQNTEEFYFERYCDAADRAAGTPITAVIDLSDQSTPQIREHFRALMRSAIYGRFSVLLQGALSPAELRIGLDELHRAFCELESEGRECNGYLPKGVLIDTPIALMSELSPCGLDFVGLDLSRLLPLLTGRGTSLNRSLAKAVYPLLHHGIQRFQTQKKIAILPSFPVPHKIDDPLLSLGIQEFYFRNQKI